MADIAPSREGEDRHKDENAVLFAERRTGGEERCERGSSGEGASESEQAKERHSVLEREVIAAIRDREQRKNGSEDE